MTLALREINDSQRAGSNRTKYFYEDWGALQRVDHYLTVADANAPTNRQRRVAYGYDENANLLTTSDDTLGGLLYTFSYDTLNRVDLATAHYLPGGDRVLDSAYDRFGNRTGLAVTGTGGPFSHTWRFNGLNQLNEAVFPGGADPTVSFAYWDSDDLRTITHGNAATTSYLYQVHGLLDSIRVVNATPSELHELVYTHDGVLNVATITESIDGTPASPAYGFGYDPQQRLTTAAYPTLPGLPSSESFHYDAAGNRDGTTSPWSYDANNRITTSPGGVDYTFDPDGNLETRTEGGTTRSFTFDATNRLREVSPEGIEYDYDPFGRRIRKLTASGTTFYLWDGDRLLAEYDDSGIRTARYAYAGGFAPLEATFASGTYDVHTDHLDTPRMLTDSGGGVVWRASYEAFGQAHLDSGNTLAEAFNIRFPGQYYDVETGLHDNRFRTYDSAVGRYISADPIGQAGGVNSYAYAGSNPTNWVDPSGLWSLTIGPYTTGSDENGDFSYWTFPGGGFGYDPDGRAPVSPEDFDQPPPEGSTCGFYGSLYGLSFEFGPISYGETRFNGIATVESPDEGSDYQQGTSYGPDVSDGDGDGPGLEVNFDDPSNWGFRITIGVGVHGGTASW